MKHGYITRSKLLLLVICTILFMSCQRYRAPQETNKILTQVIDNNNKFLLNVEMADDLERKLHVPMSLEQFKSPVFFSDYRNDLDSIITPSDIATWNHQIKEYSKRKFKKSHLSSLAYYDPDTKEVLNSEDSISEFYAYATFSPPFMNATNDKALIYFEYVSHPGSKNPINSMRLILENQNGQWVEVYRQFLAISTAN